MKNKYYDIIIIGSGIAGLYSAYNIKKTSPNISFLILEKNKKKMLGGRTGNDIFYGTNIVTGAGIGRKDKAQLLIQLLNEINVNYSEYTSNVRYSQLLEPIDILKYIEELKMKLKKDNDLHNKTFKDAFIKVFGKELYQNFIISSGYTDYENADLYETLYNYGMDDNVGGWTGLNIHWKSMIYKLYDIIGKEHFKFSCEVVEIKKYKESLCRFEIKSNNNNIFYSNKVIIATTISGIKQIIIGASKKNSLYQQIHGQPFLRLYGKFDKKSSEIMKKYVSHYTIVPGPLQKIIPINPNKGIYMISYSDNVNALIQKNFLENTEKNRMLFCDLIEKSLGLPKNILKLNHIKYYYWPIGTHYYEPLKGDFINREDFVNKAQHPEIGMLVVGEVVSRYQGWIEGALESVKKVLTKKWITDKY
jgi:hypothetical protein